ncbi:MAG: nuclease-related domain-containing protein [Candidatus Scalindua sp.]
MTIVVGKIEPLKRLKETLNNHGINRFNSIGDINTFLKRYDSEKKEIPAIVKNTLNKEIKSLEDESKHTIEKSNKNIFNKIFYYLKIKKLIKKQAPLVNNYESTISKRCMDSYQELEFIKETVEGLYTLIAGAIGENSVVNELQKLSDNYYLINDFSLDFNPPIYNKRENDRIYSIQIDHLLVCQSGVYILETKNWNTQSIESLDLRSPVEQIKRTSYALFVLLNSDSNLGLTSHHWGSKKIPLRNIIVMTNKAPKEDFQYVKVLSLNQLNGYIKYFDETFSESEAENIFNYLNNEIC